MKRLLLVSVTQDHILRGRQHQAHSCPVALALRDAIRGNGATVGAVMFFLGWGRGSGWLPLDARRYVSAFDRGQKIEPRLFVFEVGGGRPND